MSSRSGDAINPGDGLGAVLSPFGNSAVLPGPASLENSAGGRVRDGRLRTNIGNVSTLDEAVAAFNPTKRIKGKTIIRVRP